jgi:flagellar biosynthesis GTPase FlhF
MATTSFAESFKYGSRLFGLFLLVLLIGGGALGGGVALAAPEIRAWWGSGSAETVSVAGGLVLGSLGLSILVVGQFAIVYKLIADGVSKGVVDIADGSAAADEAAGDDSAAEQERPVTEATDQPAESVDSQQQSSREPSTTRPQSGTASTPQPAEERPTAEPASSEQTATREQPQKRRDEATGREQTAEEIVFGDTETQAEESGLDEQPDDSDERSAESRENVETAGDSSSDPLADSFDDE